MPKLYKFKICVGGSYIATRTDSYTIEVESEDEESARDQAEDKAIDEFNDASLEDVWIDSCKFLGERESPPKRCTGTADMFEK